MITIAGVNPCHPGTSENPLGCEDELFESRAAPSISELFHDKTMRAAHASAKYRLECCGAFSRAGLSDWNGWRGRGRRMVDAVAGRRQERG